MTDRLPGQASNPLQPLLDKLRAQPKLAMMIGGAAAVALVAAMLLWGRAPDYKPLYTNVSERDGGAIIASLQQMNVPYKFAEGSGIIMVPADKLPETRLKLAAQGLPKAGGVGFELLDNQKFGTSQFAEQINYQRALEGELARSIESIAAVDSARVHLAIPKPSLFVRDQKKPSASVVLNLHPGRSLDESQVSAITYLVSSSVPDLDPKSINVVDQQGNLLTRPGSNKRGLEVKQLEYQIEIEQGYVRRIEAILQPMFGASNVRAQVSAEIDFSLVELTDEKYKPNQEPGNAAVRSQQSSESNQSGQTPTGGVPGALSNQPPVNPTAPLSTAGGPLPPGGTAAATSNNSRRDVTTNYEVDRTIRHVQVAPGGLKRLSVAVVVNNRASTDKSGKQVALALTPQEIEQVRNLVKEAMGYSETRGDSLNVANSPFVAEEAAAAEPLWRDRELIDLAKSAGFYLLLAALGLFGWFAIGRPLLRQHLAQKKAAEAASAATAAAAAATAAAAAGEEAVATAAAAAAAEAAGIEGPAVAGEAAQKEATAAATGAESAAQREATPYELNVEYVRSVAGGNPRLVAEVITQWMNSDE